MGPTVAIGSVRELTPSEILYTDFTDYLLGGALALRNGKIDRSAPKGDAFIAKRRKKFLFDEGYCQAESLNATQDNYFVRSSVTFETIWRENQGFYNPGCIVSTNR